MHFLVISLLAILAGTLLLAKVRKDMPGKFFAFISWFFIVVGFVLFIGFIAGGICRMTHHGCDGPPPHGRCEMMMKECHHGMPGSFGCPQGMDKEMCAKKAGCCMPHDSTMKCCSKHMGMGCDSTKMAVPKK